RQHVEGRRGELDVFASQGRLTQLVEEIRGQGISGPYALSRADGRLNTEQVEIVTRDRNQSSVILRRVPQVRFADYTLEPFTGRLLFRVPVPSLDANLNPVFIRVSYEVEQGGDAFWQYGATGQARLGERAEVGGTLVRDDNPLGAWQVVGAHSAFRLAEGTYLLGELAYTDGDTLEGGAAGRVELRHHAGRLDARVYGLRSQIAFQNPSATFAGGRGEYGARGTWLLDGRTRLLGEALRTEDVATGGRRDGALLGVERRFGERVTVELGYRYGRETATPASDGSAATAGATPNETNALRTRLGVELLDRRRATVFGELEQDLVETEQRRAAIGGDYLFARRARLYGRHEWISSFAGPYALNGAQRLSTTVLGLDADYYRGNRLFSEYRARDAFNGREAEAAIGLRNRWPVGPGLVFNTSFERVEPLRGGGQTATAVTGAVEYTRNPLWKGTARAELRSSASGDSWLGTVGYGRKVSRDFTLLGRGLFSTVGDAETRARAQLGVAWRQTDVDRWNALARYEYRYEHLTPSGLPEATRGAHVFSTDLNFQAGRRVGVTGRYAGKIATDESDSMRTRQAAHLFSGRAVVDLTEKWDAGIIGSLFGDGDFSTREYGLGVEVGRRVARNLRIALGFNLFGFRDADLTGVNATQQGLYIDLGWKFDESLFGRRAAPSAGPSEERPQP
ncbi:MAG: hypothetical protein ACREMR_09900, partial [Gemmatimonadales bacterium]